MKPHRIRHQFHLNADLSRKLDALATEPGRTKSAVLEAAILAWIERRGANELDERFAVRLNRLSRQLDRVERDQKIILESLALYIRQTLQRDAHLPDPDPAARARGRERFEAFIEQVGRKLAQGGSEITPSEDLPS